MAEESTERSGHRATDGRKAKGKTKPTGDTKPKPKAAASIKRCCACCKKHLPKSDYSKNQWSKKSAAKCKSCISNITTTTQEQEATLALSLIPVERTEAFRVRQNNTITPKDRLITFCELGIIMDLGDLNDGILPEILHVHDPGDDGYEEFPYTITPYEYWGLPIEGAYAHGSKKFKKKIRKQCEYFFQLDQNWMVKNPQLVKPYFDEVVTEGDKRPWNGLVNTDGISWAAQVESLKSAIAYYRDNDALAEDFGSMRMNDSWQPPTGSDAYQVRSSNTIAPKDRLYEYCELSSLNAYGCIEKDGVVNATIPRRTTNSYWGISRLGGQSAQEISTWNYWMETELQWFGSHAALVQPHFEEIASMGYSKSIQMLSFVMHLRGRNE